MRTLFSIVGLLLVVLVIGIVTKKQLAAVAPAPAATTGVSGTPSVAPMIAASDVKQTVEGMLQAPRPGSEEK